MTTFNTLDVQKSSIIPFAFKGYEIRTVLVDGEPAFVGKDVCDRLGYADPTNAMKLHCRGVVKRHPIVDALGRAQNARILFEPDVLRLIIKSRLPEAEEFERWVFEEVLPSIRKTGGYRTIKAPANMVEALTLALEQQKALDAKDQEIAELAPQAGALQKLASLEGVHNLRSAAQQCGWPERKFINRLIELGWLYIHSVTGRKCAYADKIKAGLMESKNVEVKRSGYVEGVGQPMITQKGLAKIRTIIGDVPADDTTLPAELARKATPRPFAHRSGAAPT
ncbi:phage antirepressor [Komagataeibacter oboediens]|uniref:phage antirepressor n=1 Tax=Komagataeibacter oboediens TaxID=65958 RepID=UPI0019070109|nr:phage antirepressor [Komagataeibacter oboediens]GCE81718.1 phage associated-antirepressor BRO [Komagataeibacter oboediens]